MTIQTTTTVDIDLDALRELLERKMDLATRDLASASALADEIRGNQGLTPERADQVDVCNNLITHGPAAITARHKIEDIEKALRRLGKGAYAGPGTFGHCLGCGRETIAKDKLANLISESTLGDALLITCSLESEFCPECRKRRLRPQGTKT